MCAAARGRDLWGARLVRVLVANKFWYRRAGLEQVMFDEIAEFEKRGHEVAHFSTNHPANVASPWSDYFVPYLELGASGHLTAADKVRAAVRLFSNGEAARRFARLVSDFRPDVVHVHGIHRQISPSILVVARRLGVPVVQTIHDMHKVCPQDLGVRGEREPCLPRSCGRYWYGAAVSNRCCRGSAAVSALAAAELSFQRVRHVYERNVTRFITASRFTADMVREGGITSVPIDIVRDPIEPAQTAEPSDFFLFVGRLVPGKGAETFLSAANEAGVRAVVAGDGELIGQLRELAPSAEFLGWVAPEAVPELRRTALASVVPSLCLEVGPLSAIEALAAGVPVVGSDLGGIREIVDDGVNGLLVPPGDVRALGGALRRLAANPAEARRMGLAGREKVAREFGVKRHVDGVLETYSRAMGAS
jgi:glycosyltransferase involved in cell wall biosynthesis